MGFMNVLRTDSHHEPVDENHDSVGPTFSDHTNRTATNDFCCHWHLTISDLFSQRLFNSWRTIPLGAKAWETSSWHFPANSCMTWMCLECDMLLHLESRASQSISIADFGVYQLWKNIPLHLGNPNSQNKSMSSSTIYRSTNDLISYPRETQIR